MTRSFLIASIVLASMHLLPLLWEPQTPSFDHRTAASLLETGDPETLLAFGRRVPFSEAGVYELELVPRISDRLAFRIDDERRAIQMAARRLPPARALEAFEAVDGIGPKIAARIGEFIDVQR